MLDWLLKANTDSIKSTKKRAEKAKEALTKLENIDGLENLKKKFKELKEKIDPLEVEHFQNFLAKHGFKSVDEYEKEAFQVYPSGTYENRRKFFLSLVEMNEKIIQKLRSARKHVNRSPQFLKSVKEDFKKLEDDLEGTEKEIAESKEKSIETNQQLLEAYKKVLEKRAEFNELEKDYESQQSRICDEIINIQIAMVENYRLMYHALVNCDHIPLRDGSLVELLEIPDNVEADFNLVENSLQR